jgi:hypothetical protein
MPKSQVKRDLIPLYFPDGVFIPDRASNPVGQYVESIYRYADGSLEAVTVRC